MTITTRKSQANGERGTSQEFEIFFNDATGQHGYNNEANVFIPIEGVGGGNVSTAGLTANRTIKATGANTIADSSFAQEGANFYRIEAPVIQINPNGTSLAGRVAVALDGTGSFEWQPLPVAPVTPLPNGPMVKDTPTSYSITTVPVVADTVGTIYSGRNDADSNGTETLFSVNGNPQLPLRNQDGSVVAALQIKANQTYLVERTVSATIPGGYYQIIGIQDAGGVSPFVAGAGANSAQLNGTGSIAAGAAAVAEGTTSNANGPSSHAEGVNTLASGTGSHSGGRGDIGNAVAASGEGSFNHSHAIAVLGSNASGDDSAILGGLDNNASGINSSVVGGNANAANGLNSSITGGLGNTTGPGAANAHVQGNNNTVNGISAHAEGSGNLANATGSHAEGNFTLANGAFSHVGGRGAAFPGPAANGTGSFNHSSATGPITSNAIGSDSAILGGENHIANSANSVVMGGSGNQSTGNNSGVFSGEGGRANGVRATALGGFDTQANAQDAVAIGGTGNRANSNDSAVVGGNGNAANAIDAAILGGLGNTVSGLRSVALGGQTQNITEADTAGVNSIRATQDFRCASTGNNMVGIATLVGGTVDVNNSSVKTGARIFCTHNTPAGVVGVLSTPAANINDSTSFRINSSSAADTSTVNYWILNP